MGSYSEIDAKKIQVNEPKEVLQTYLEVYCMLVFTPYVNRHGDNSWKSFSANSSSSPVERGIDEQCSMGILHFPRLAYEDNLCGFNRGEIVESQKIIIDCSVSNNSETLDCQEVKRIVVDTENQLKRLLEKYRNKAEYVTLHLGVYSFTLTEDIANSFLYSLQPDASFYPEDTSISVYFTLDHFSPLLVSFKDLGLQVIIDYYIVYDNEPFLCSSSQIEDEQEEPTIEQETLKATIQKSQKVEGVNPDKETADYIDNGSQCLLKKQCPIPNVEKSASAVAYEGQNESFAPQIVLNGSVSKSVYLSASHTIEQQAEENFSWSEMRVGAHAFLENFGKNTGTAGLIVGAVGVGALVVLAVVGAPVTGALATVAASSFAIASALGTVSIASGTANGYMYLYDSATTNNQKDQEYYRRKAFNTFGGELVNYGIGKMIGPVFKTKIRTVPGYTKMVRIPNSGSKTSQTKLNRISSKVDQLEHTKQNQGKAINKLNERIDKVQNSEMGDKPFNSNKLNRKLNSSTKREKFLRKQQRIRDDLMLKQKSTERDLKIKTREMEDSSAIDGVNSFTQDVVTKAKDRFVDNKPK